MGKRGKRFLLTFIFLFPIFVCVIVLAQEQRAELFSGQDLSIEAGQMTVYQEGSTGGKEHILLFEYNVQMQAGPNRLTSERALVWIKPVYSSFRGVSRVFYQVQVYLEEDVSMKSQRGSRTVDFQPNIIEKGKSLVSRFQVTGEVFTTADLRYSGTLEELYQTGIYQNSQTVIRPIRRGPVIVADAMVPSLRGEAALEQKLATADKRPAVPQWERTDVLGLPQPPVAPAVARPADAEPEAPEYEYPVNIAGLWEPAPSIESTKIEDGRTVTTVIGRFYLWQIQDESGAMLEFQADSAVIYSRGQGFSVNEQESGSTMGSGDVEAVYFKGNIVMADSGGTIRAEEIYYDFLRRQALAVRAERRSFDPSRGVPIYMRAEELRQVSKYVFRADDVVVTTSEFFEPQVALHSSSVVLTDLTGVAARQEEMDDSKYDMVMKDVTLKIDQLPVFYWPKIRTDLERPDIPLKRLSLGYDTDYGPTFESDWNLAKLLGRKPEKGVDSVLAADYYGDRGYGAGADIEYTKTNYYGYMRSYLLNNEGNDKLGDTSDRRDVDPGRDLRGRLQWRHRQFLPYDWQATFEAAYSTDETYLEQFNRTEFNTGKEQETLVHLKRIKDNWGFSFLNKFRIMDFQETTEEIPTVDFHLKGQSFWDHKLTYYMDVRASRLRERFTDGEIDEVPEDFYTYTSTRHEVDLPILSGPYKIVPFVAGTAAYNELDEMAFQQNIDGDIIAPENSVFIGEVGVRLSTLFWKEYPNAKSRLWDVNGIRHIVKPHAELVMYQESDDTAEMRDMMNFGVLHRWQTRRGQGAARETIDWMRLDTNLTFLNDNADETAGPAYFIWNDPSIPTLLRRRNTIFGPVRNAFTADYMWRVSNSMSLLSDMHYDLQDASLQQYNFGISRYVYPDISYYFGGRYLKNSVVDIPEDNIFERGSYSLVGALTYRMNSRYTLAFSQEYNIEYKELVLIDVSLIRHYHRMYYALGYTNDYSRDRETLLFSIWPEGVRELALGTRSYGGITGMSLEE